MVSFGGVRGMSLSPTLQLGVINSEGFREVDYMEYSSDANAQTAYATNGTAGPEIVANGTDWTGATGATPPDSWTDSGLATYVISSGTLKITNDSGYATLVQTLTIVTGQKYSVSIDLKNGDCVSGIRLQVGSSLGGNQYGSETETGTSGFTTHTFSFTATGTACYVEIQPLMGGVGQYAYVDNCSVKITNVLQSYSEGTIKTQGSYSLKVMAAITDSLNKTLTKTFSTNKDFSLIDTLRIDLRSSRTGSTIKLGLHDTGGTTSEKIPSITTADEFEILNWDLSNIDVADKDDIDKFIITITDADAANTLYIDSFRKRSRKQTFVVFVPTIATGNPIGLLLALTYYNN